MKRLGVISAVVLALGVAAGAVPQVMWQLPTAAPKDSIWEKALTDMTAAWARDTGGRVRATVFAGGKLGTEASIVRAMRVNNYQASLFMVTGGLAQIDDGFNALAIPFFFKDDAEMVAVRDALTPDLEKRLNAKGFHLLSWTTGGWVRLFSVNPLRTLADIKKAKLWTSDTDVKMTTWYKTNGFNPVPLDANAAASQLKIGMIDATPSPAYLALLLGMQNNAKYMLDVNLGPFLGALVVTTKAWNAVSPEDQAKLTAAAKVFETKTSVEMPANDAKAVTEMKARGLTVVQMAQKDLDELYATVGKLTASMRNDMVPAEMFDKAVAARDAYRKKK
ncbi:MAG TPA: TRAP transporter substrate-binding protein DctP [Vicinamibacterales bacterium]|nr:TRAP transporter substrate-binding protein DctP [Vicinamibacterales bacterium]